MRLPRDPEHAAPVASAWAPLREPLFRSMWLASLVSGLGTWMQNAAGAWLMTSLSDSAILVSLMQTATSLPVLLLGLPAGALADLVDRRKLLIYTNLFSLLAAIGLAIATAVGGLGALGLLFFTFLLGVGAACTYPAWQSSTPEFVARDRLPQAVALNGGVANLARAIGPALGGTLVLALGPQAVFALNALSFMFVIRALARWRRAHPPSDLPREHFLGALGAGIRHVRFSIPLQLVFVKAGLFILGGSVLFALMPLLARNQLGLGALGYGLLLGFFGAGSVAAVGILPRIRSKFSTDKLVLLATLVTAASAFGAGLSVWSGLTAALMLSAGFSWISVMSSLNVAVQQASPNWVRARALASYFVVFQGLTALSAFMWGSVAEATSVTRALEIAAGALLVGGVAGYGFKLQGHAKLEMAPAALWADPEVAYVPRPADGPVMVTVRYCVPTQAHNFLRMVHHFRRVRLRDGAYAWGVYRSLEQQNEFVEVFWVHSWAEHLRQSARLTQTDAAQLERVYAFHAGHGPPHVGHYIYGRAAMPSRMPAAYRVMKRRLRRTWRRGVGLLRNDG